MPQGAIASTTAEITLQERAQGAYLGLAVGDALGATVEFMTPREIGVQLGRHEDITGGGWLRLKAGQVTDDTTMSLALGEAILQQGAVEPRAVAEAFNAWLRSKPVDVGNTVRRGIVHYRYTGDTEVMQSDYDAGNGACMRTLPVALAYYQQPVERIQHASRMQAHVTHHNALSDAACECVIAMLHGALEGQERLHLLLGPAQALVSAHAEFAFDGRRRENPGAYIVETMQAVFQALFDHNNFADCLIDVVNRGGDADTTGAITGMIAGALYGAEAIPRKWLKALDAEVRQRCSEQALALISLAFKGQTIN